MSAPKPSAGAREIRTGVIWGVSVPCDVYGPVENIQGVFQQLFWLVVLKWRVWRAIRKAKAEGRL